MSITIGIAISFVAGLAISAIILLIWIKKNIVISKKKKSQAKNEDKRNDGHSKPKIEFTKLVLMLMLLTFFVGVYVGVKIVFVDTSQLGVLLAYIGTPCTSVALFYIWKAKAENVIKIKKANPNETQGIPIDLNNINVNM